MNAYEKVESLRKIHPNESTAALIKRARTSQSNYYRLSQKAKATTGKKRGRKPKYQRIETSAAPARQMAVVFGSPEQIREVLGGLN